MNWLQFFIFFRLCNFCLLHFVIFVLPFFFFSFILLVLPLCHITCCSFVSSFTPISLLIPLIVLPFHPSLCHPLLTFLFLSIHRLPRPSPPSFISFLHLLSYFFVILSQTSSYFSFFQVILYSSILLSHLHSCFLHLLSYIFLFSHSRSFTIIIYSFPLFYHYFCHLVCVLLST